MTIQNLRRRLQRDLANQHSALDDLVSQFDLTDEQGMAGFLWMHFVALSNIKHTAPRADTKAMIQDLLKRIETDLDLIRVSKNMHAKCDIYECNEPLAAEYVLGGSRLGAEVLKRRWQGSALAASGVGQAYMTAPRHLNVWRGFCEVAERMPAHSAQADRITLDAGRIFDFYTATALQAREVTHCYV